MSKSKGYDWGLFDTDIVAYKEASRNQRDTCWGAYTDLSKALRDAQDVIHATADKLKLSNVMLCFSDGDLGGTSRLSTKEHNFRFGVLPTYKSNRLNVKRPELLRDVKQFLFEEYLSMSLPGCEADDVMGILATHPTHLKGSKVIISEDKDLRTIPAPIFAPHRSELGAQVISELDANRFHMWQTIVGDTTDGYKGACGVGPKSVYADEVLGADAKDLWDIVWEAFASKGLTETDAITQARVARILRSEDYDLETKSVRLWTPELLLKELWK